MSTEQLGMFEVPDAPRALLPPERIWPAIAKWVRWRGAHQACDICGRLVLQLGMAVAPAARPARWTRHGPNNKLAVCEMHKLELKPRDDEVEAGAMQQRELVAQQQVRRKARAHA